MPKPTTSANIRAEMARAGVQQAEIAQLLGLSVVSVSSRMVGHIKWRLHEVQAIASHLGVPLSVLAGEPGPAEETSAAEADSAASA